eukprot:2955919-Rhodomonas_salina.2
MCSPSKAVPYRSEPQRIWQNQTVLSGPAIEAQLIGQLGDYPMKFPIACGRGGGRWELTEKKSRVKTDTGRVGSCVQDGLRDSGTAADRYPSHSESQEGWDGERMGSGATPDPLNIQTPPHRNRLETHAPCRASRG